MPQPGLDPVRPARLADSDTLFGELVEGSVLSALRTPILRSESLPKGRSWFDGLTTNGVGLGMSH